MARNFTENKSDFDMCRKGGGGGRQCFEDRQTERENFAGRVSCKQRAVRPKNPTRPHAVTCLT